MFGCESDFDKIFRVGVSKERLDKFDFIVIPTTHLHMPGFTIEDRKYSMEERAVLWVERFEKLLELDLPWHKVGIAHLACPLLAWSTKEDYLYALSLISSEDMYRLFKKAAGLGVGIEINAYDMNFDEADTDAVLRMFRIAKECGCKFYLGSDSHNPQGFVPVMDYFNRAIDLLNLTEDDKFHIGK